MSSISEMERKGQDHIGESNGMTCLHCGLPFTRDQNGIRSFGCGSSFMEVCRPQWARSMTCLEIENQSMKDAIKFFEDLSISEGRRILDASNTAKTTMSDTPITMEEVAKFGRVDIEFARKLERELNEANSIIRQQQLLEEENLGLRQRINQLEYIIDRAANQFFADGSDGKTAAEMLIILNETSKEKP
jgi:hypothetical protein